MFGIAGAIVGGIGIAAGVGTSVSAQRSADKASDKAVKQGQSELAFSQKQYDDWQAIYGPIQQRLHNYYMSLDANSFASRGLNELNKQYSAVLTELDKDLARRGVDSPAADSIKAQLGLDLARNRAEIRQQAPMQLAAAQQGFLASNTLNPAAQGVMGSMQGMQNMYGQQAAVQSNLAYQSGAAAGQTLTNTLTSYYSNKAYNDRTKALQSSQVGGLE